MLTFCNNVGKGYENSDKYHTYLVMTVFDWSWEPACWTFAGNLWFESDVVRLYWVPGPGRRSSLKLFEALNAGFLDVQREEDI